MSEAPRRIRVLGVLGLLTGVAVALVLLRPPGTAAIIHAVAVLSTALTAHVCFRMMRYPGLGPPSRAFWRRNLIAISTMTVAEICGLIAVREPAATGPGTLLRFLAATCFAWSLLRLSAHVDSGAQKVALGLDITTVTAGTMIILGHVVLADVMQAGAGIPPQTMGLLITSTVGIFLVTRLALGGGGLLPPRSLIAIGAGACAGGMVPPVGMLLLGWAPGTPGSEALLIGPLLANLGVGLTGRFQLADAGTAAAAGIPGTWRRMLPYASVVAVDVLLLARLHHDDDRLTLVTVGAVFLTGLVVARQIVAARESEVLDKRFRLLVQNSSDIISISDPEGRVTYCSPAIHRVLGLAASVAVGTRVADWSHPDQADDLRDCWTKTLSGPGASATCRIQVRNSAGEWRWIEIVTSNLLHEPSVGGILTNSRDVTETTLVQAKLSHEATHDALTGLANRALYTRRVEAAVVAGAPFSIALVDLDGFKNVNDTLGHAAGDALLIAVAERMTANVRASDTVARLGGDEFAILFDGLTGAPVDRVLNRIAEALLIPVAVQEKLISVRASFGVADADGGDVDELLHNADIAMYAAKVRGEGGHVRHRAGMSIQARHDTAGPLRTAIDDGQLVLHYQPVVTLPDGRPAGVEALVRWQHPERGLLGPGEFVPLAEETGLIVALGAWVLREAVRQTAAWSLDHGDAAPGTVAVNVSAAQLREDGFAAEVAAVLRDAGLPAARLCAEITESTAIGGGATAQNLTALRELGVRLSLDDFGTGAATLSTLAACPVDQIKLDRSFVDGPDAIPEAVIQLAHALGIEAVAEGIETPEQADRLARLGYELAQGYLFARPMPAAALSAWLPVASSHGPA
ncbi:putative bifunctional diguanylate cyclase/phosphodiesterase [Actinoplanes rectilineatus]|uniref:putative bifunctional diguanylate cyclase/phosphodiesterase n=1 Tax=Actinoplanes rectilineatus TaxID=113571 RepID=UPI0006963C67|nr:EAL domain-containing protein [Actinoplanes rectilineatus]